LSCSISKYVTCGGGIATEAGSDGIGPIWTGGGPGGSGGIWTQ